VRAQPSAALVSSASTFIGWVLSLVWSVTEISLLQLVSSVAGKRFSLRSCSRSSCFFSSGGRGFINFVFVILNSTYILGGHFLESGRVWPVSTSRALERHPSPIGSTPDCCGIELRTRNQSIACGDDWISWIF